MLISKRTIIILHDLFMAALAWQFAWWARFNFEIPFPGFQLSLYTIPVVVLIQGFIFSMFHLYRGMWRFASLPDLWNIVRASVLGALGITLALFILFRLEGVPRSILVLYPILLIFFLGGPRLSYRYLKDRKLSLQPIGQAKRVLIIGAGRSAEMLVREMLRDGQYFPVGFVDDRPDLRHSEIHGVRVLGPVDSIAEFCRRTSPEVIVIAIRSATGAQMQRIVEKCEETGVPLRTLPGLDEMVAGAPVLRELREVSVEDLLGRERVELDWKAIESGLAGKVVLISGGGGSIGSELCRQIARLAPARLVVLDRSEFNLYRIHRQVGRLNPALRVHAELGDIRDGAAVERLLKRHHPEVVFHAAAYKHVPMLQEHVREAVLNNIFGTITLADAVRRQGCEKFVLISTDKAVAPANVLGASKRVAELLCEARNSGAGTKFITVRFGNVLGSDGSVIPLFQEQIDAGGPVTVTHPEVSRYFMTVREACELILQAGAMGRGGEVFVLDMGNPVKIAYLAEQMIRLAGAVPGRDVRIEFTGLRPGEKLFEELFHSYEQREQTAHRKIFLARHPEIDRQFLEARLTELRAACDHFDEEAIAGLLKTLTSGAPLREARASNVVSIVPGGGSP
ncbi:MAG: polysaccharide biosynthesis protein [Gammaproteobacteria bacterium]|nr:polysaccharide biosynthesis protein [Gammaproteobacteria bacterium]